MILQAKPLELLSVLFIFQEIQTSSTPGSTMQHQHGIWCQWGWGYKSQALELSEEYSCKKCNCFGDKWNGEKLQQNTFTQTYFWQSSAMIYW